MVKKARGGTFGAPNGPDAEEAAAKRWKQAEQEPEQGAGAAAPLVPQPPAEPRGRRSSASYEPGATLLPVKGQLPYSELGAHGEPSHQLTADTTEIVRLLEQKAGRGGSPPFPAATEQRFDELLSELLSRSEITEALQRAGLPTIAHQAVAVGVSQKLGELRGQHIHQSSYGRVAHNAIFQAAVCKLREYDVPIKLVAEVLGVHRSTIYRAMQRNDTCVQMGEAVILDPHRARRRDATSLEDVAKIENFWAANTRPSPDRSPVATMTTLEGEKVQHGVHWQEKTLKELYELFCEDSSMPIVGREVFRLLRPYFIRKPVWRGCLCPKCHVMRLLIDGLGDLLRACVSDKNTCTCVFCTTHKAAAVDAKDAKTSYPPETITSLFSACFCPKKEAKPDSGYNGTMPCFDISCVCNRLEGKQKAFIDDTGNNPALLDPVPTACPTCAPKFPLTAPSDCKFLSDESDGCEVSYLHYVKAPRLGRSDASDREDLQEKEVTRLEYLKTCREQLSVTGLHRYVDDVQDAGSELLIAHKRERAVVWGMDFSMNMTCIPREELKQEFWNRTQVSLHPVLAYHDWYPQYGDTCYPGDKPRAERMMQTHVHLSDDPKHDTHYVDANMRTMCKIFDVQRSEAGVLPMNWLSLLSDNGPEHYKCARSFYNMSILQSAGAPELCGVCKWRPASATTRVPCNHLGEDMLLEWIFLAPDHGKSVWDGIAGLKKNRLANGELRRGKQQLPLINAERCAAYLNETERKKAAGFETRPFPVREGSTYSNEISEHYVTDAGALRDARTKQKDAKGCEGSHSHYHLRFVTRGQLKMRWLYCPCAACWAQNPDGCANKAVVGQWADREVSVTDTVGVAALTVRRKALSEKIAEEIVLGDVVACWTTEDVTDRRQYWLGEVTHLPFHVAEKDGIVDPAAPEQHFRGPSGDRPGEHLLKIRWLDRVGLATEHDLTFERLKETEYLVHVSTLRCGKLKLEPRPAPTRRGRDRLELSMAQHGQIMDQIQKEFQDEA